MAKSQSAPLVTSVSTTLRKTIPNKNTEVITPDEIKTKKKDMLEVIDNSMELFKSNLLAGKVTMTTSADLERLIKLMLLVSGEADSRAGKPYGETEQETVSSSQVAAVSMSKIESILNLEDDEVKSMFDRLYKGYNEANDIDD